jgi:hypothetical protein
LHCKAVLKGRGFYPNFLMNSELTQLEYLTGDEDGLMPDIIISPSADTFKISRSRLRPLVECASSDQTKPSINCIHFSSEGWAYATDGFRLLAVYLGFKPSKDYYFYRKDFAIYLQRDTVRAGQGLSWIDLSRIPSATAGQLGKNGYPDVRLIMPKSYQHLLDVGFANGAKLTTMLNRVGLESMNLAALEFDGNQAKITHGTSSSGYTRWLPPECLDIDGLRGDMPSTMIFDNKFVSTLKRVKFRQILANRKLGIVQFRNSDSADFYLIHPVQLADYNPLEKAMASINHN